MHIKTLGNTVLIIGILIALVAVLADSIGVGGSPGFGPVQIMGLILGPIVSFIGLELRGQSDDTVAGF